MLPSHPAFAGHPAPTIAALGPVIQLAYVPIDFDAALEFWVKTMGVGPFFVIDHVKLDRFEYRGKPARIDYGVALAYWQGIQIELIRQHDDTPSIYTEWRQQERQGVHHVCVSVTDLAQARAACAASGAEVVQEVSLRGGASEVIYVDALGDTGGFVEILKADDAGSAFFSRVREAARDWDGSDPVRRIGGVQ